MPSGVSAPTTTSKLTLNDSPGAMMPPPSWKGATPPLSAVAPVPMRKRTSFAPESNSAWSESVGSVLSPVTPAPPGLERIFSDPGS